MTSMDNATEFTHMVRVSDPAFRPPELYACGTCYRPYQLAETTSRVIAPGVVRPHLIKGHNELCPGSSCPPAQASHPTTHWCPPGCIRTQCCHRLPSQIPAFDGFTAISAISTCRTTGNEAGKEPSS